MIMGVVILGLQSAHCFLRGEELLQGFFPDFPLFFIIYLNLTSIQLPFYGIKPDSSPWSTFPYYIKEIKVDMDFEDELPCGGYANEDNQIKLQIQAISLGAETNTCSKSNCKNCQCSSDPNLDGQAKRDLQEYIKKQECTQTDRECIDCQEVEVESKLKKGVICKKCKSNKAVLLQKGEAVCRECLFRSMEYKCRLLLENTYKIDKNTNVLICFSGGMNSICLVNVLANLRKRYQKNKLFNQLKCIHIKQRQTLPLNYNKLFQENTGIELQIIGMEEIIGQGKQLGEIRNIIAMFDKGTNSVDLIGIFRDRLVFEYARKNKFDFVLKGLNGEGLAAETFRYFTKGIGGNIPDLGSRGVPGHPHFYYPFRHHLQKELQYYYHTHRLHHLALPPSAGDLESTASAPIDSRIRQFIEVLQAMHSHTAPAIVRTAQKIEAKRENEEQCRWCRQHGIGEDGLCRRCLRIWQGRNKKFDAGLVPEWMRPI